MNLKIPFSSLILVGLVGYSQQNSEPPLTQKNPDTLFFAGNMVIDNYTYLEDYKEPEVAEWYKAQADYANSLLDKISGQELILKEFSNIEQVMSPNLSQVQRLDNGSYFFLRLEPDGRPERAFIKPDHKETATVLFDPLTYKPETGYYISRIAPSPKGTKLAVILYPNAGQEDGELLILDLEKSENVVDTLYDVPGQPISWIDENSFYVSRSRGQEELNKEVFLHQLEDPENDKLIFSAKKFPELNIMPEENPHVVFYPEQNLTIANVYTTLGHFKTFVKDKEQWKPLTSIDDVVTRIEVTKDGIYYKSGKNAPRFRILKLSLKQPAIKDAVEVVAEPESGNITDFAPVAEGVFYVIKENGVQSSLFFKQMDDEKIQKIELPVFPANIEVKAIKNAQEIEMAVSGWTTPGLRYIFNYNTNKFKDLGLVEHKSIPELENLIVEEVLIPSHDQTLVPVSLIYSDKIKKDSKNIVLMSVYGAYGQNNGPDYIPQLMALTNLGLIIAFPHVRGGGELGEGWHKAGQKELKYNTWKDVIASAEYLIENGYTTAEKIILQGGSAGGIAAGMAMNERPNLFGAVINEVGAVSLMNKYEVPTAKINNHEFGDVNVPQEFEIVKAMNAFTHLKEGTAYPSTLVYAGYNDPRILPYMPGKYFAKLQHSNTSDNPIIFVVDFSQGHGPATYDEFKKIFARNLSFALWQTGHPEFSLKN
ncbi:prolyl oligopeptidase family serine peptidase [Salinimicrobium sp. TH3]|uniref:prolyl oligopeptidase family serine peptidase n=1 Tax=Salinimicrobium sp. TH3 TaxID=2997342 RepID=UPI002273158C|nr:prolyl oligopeptidase family serine peptidase [Salinimicrobium sp. TH3]MCY2687597.1 prolyl oligopeptidase family serine peptidase [Salinimicrobium sp. TH3]